MMLTLRLGSIALAIAALAGCDTVSETLNKRPPVDVAQPTALRPQAIVVPTANNGSIFQAGQYRPLFEDYRARLVGDVITVQIVEKVSATQKSTSSIDKSGALAAGVTAIPGLSANSFTAARATLGATSSNTYAGKGSTENSNDFSGTITATVIDVLPNGHLIVSGEKQIGINQGSEFVRFSGVVNPATVSATNQVSSNQVADARLEYRGNGYIDEAQTMGWLARFFLSFLAF